MVLELFINDVMHQRGGGGGFPKKYFHKFLHQGGLTKSDKRLPNLVTFL